MTNISLQAPTVSEVTTSLSRAEKYKRVRECLTEYCITSLQSLLPEPGRDRAHWKEDSVRTLTVIFYLQLVEYESEDEGKKIENTLIASVIEALATREFFPDPQDQRLLVDLDTHLRLLIAALRLYKYDGRSMTRQLHENVYNGITKLGDVFEITKKRSDERTAIDTEDITFRIIHCQSLLVSIENNDTLAKKISRRVITGFDTALASVGQNWHEIRPGLMEILKLQRSQPKWHDEYILLEDACRSIFSSDLHSRGATDEADIRTLTIEAESAIFLLRDSLEHHIQSQRDRKKGHAFARHAIGLTTKLISEAGPYEEHSDYMQYGILDLLSQLSISIRNRSRRDCFREILSIIKMVLEQSPKSAKLLRLKATDLWNRVSELAKKDGVVYGNHDDRAFIEGWVNRHSDEVEASKVSSLYRLSGHANL